MIKQVTTILAMTAISFSAFAANVEVKKTNEAKVQSQIKPQSETIKNVEKDKKTVAKPSTLKGEFDICYGNCLS